MANSTDTLSRSLEDFWRIFREILEVFHKFCRCHSNRRLCSSFQSLFLFCLCLSLSPSLSMYSYCLFQVFMITISMFVERPIKHIIYCLNGLSNQEKTFVKKAYPWNFYVDFGGAYRCTRLDKDMQKRWRCSAVQNVTEKFNIIQGLATCIRTAKLVRCFRVNPISDPSENLVFGLETWKPLV